LQRARRSERRRADSILIDKAWSRVKAPDSSLGEKAAAYCVTNTMKAKKTRKNAIVEYLDYQIPVTQIR